MNRKLLVTLLRKDIQELEMITEGFMEMNEYPKTIIQLARRKTEDIQSYINQLSEIKSETIAAVIKDINQPLASPIQKQAASLLEKPVMKTTIDTDTSEEILEEIDAALETTSELVEVDEISETIENSEVIDAIEDDESIEIIEVSNNNSGNGAYNSTDDIRRTFLGEKNSATTPTRNTLLSTPENTISSNLANKKIDDIKQAISIGDRFRFQRELFRGNGEDMNKTLTYLNLLATQNEALSFLQSKYGWTSDNETAEDFYQIVRRRFI